MPELPEVETVLRTLEQQIKGREITGITILYPKMIEDDPDEFTAFLMHQHFNTFQRRGKYLIFGLDHGYLVSHLRMEGKYYLMKPEEPLTRHMHVVFDLDDGRQLRYNDTRKFGRMKIYPEGHDFTHFHDLGPEPFDDAFNADYMHAYKKGRKCPVKELMLEQSFVAGVGNIYADEILAASHVRPGRSCARLTRKEEEAIVRNTKEILAEAIRCGGTTIRTYTSSLGVTGRFQLYCSVHMQKTCRVCGSEIKVKWIGGRSSYYCPHCQK